MEESKELSLDEGFQQAPILLLCSQAMKFKHMKLNTGMEGGVGLFHLTKYISDAYLYSTENQALSTYRS